MKKQQSGFTLVEIAIVLVIIGLLLGGVLKGQELINSAKVKNFATDFRNIPLFIYGYQDKYRAIPGDDTAVATTHLGAAVGGVAVVAATTPAGTLGNGTLNGAWNS
ncbi:MAG: prepilin-type N-terminal cleavage/methylation domain-containing protein, partial [Deltaproteobacteria bacterium]|nr:prepilin-type N-terminal cleavage/methylation domain-containing protein [Deltaproteobacteria bacterium]